MACWRLSSSTARYRDRQGQQAHNLVITALSIGAASIIGTIEILGILPTEVHLRGAFWSLMADFNISLAGFCITGLFVAV